jgi:putative aldouronate transport system permease protein
MEVLTEPEELPKNSYVSHTGEVVPVRHASLWKRIRKNWQMYTFVALPVLFLLVFRYAPMIGNVIAFRRFKAGGALLGDKWVGLHYFDMFWHNAQFWNVFWNTFILGGLWLIIGFPLPLILALMLNELRSRTFKRSVQTITYLPHFLSIVIVAGIVLQLTSVDGTVNQILHMFGVQPIPFMQHPEFFRAIYIVSEAWQTVGWGTILYLAALTTIDDQLYEAARIDGANRWRQTWHITLPGIRPTIVVLLVLNAGTFMGIGFEKVLLLQNPLIYSTGDVITTYLYRVGIGTGQYSYATAIGLFESVIGLVMVFSANAVSRRLVGSSLW